MFHLLAHAGHGSTQGNSLLHWIIEPAHLPLTFCAAVLIAGLALLAMRRRKA